VTFAKMDMAIPRRQAATGCMDASGLARLGLGTLAASLVLHESCMEMQQATAGC
jgi:hypothetical protein